MYTHPFAPLISKDAKKLLVGTLPPENVSFYFSNSTNTRLWDLLLAVRDRSEIIGKGGVLLSVEKKNEILDSLKLGITDIIYEYERSDFNSTNDKDIIPLSYNNLLQLAIDHGIEELLFVYQSALKWFLHSIKKTPPVRLSQLGGSYEIGPQEVIWHQGKLLKCTLLPSPLNRGTKGQTLAKKLDLYRRHILM